MYTEEELLQTQEEWDAQEQAREKRAAYMHIYEQETDEQVFARLRRQAEDLGRPPKRTEVPASDYLKTRFGPWPRILEKAGLKEISQRRLEKLAKKNGGSWKKDRTT